MIDDDGDCDSIESVSEMTAAVLELEPFEI